MARFLDGDLLRRVRVELGLTQEEAAARLGIDARSYRRYEAGAVNDARAGFVVRHASRRRVIDRLCAELGIAEDELLVERGGTQATPASPTWRPRRVHPLPRAQHFVGRAALVDELASWLVAQEPRDRVVAIVAVGGAGKTSLIERVVSAPADEPRPAGLLVWSFYEDPRVDAFVRESVAYLAPDEPPTLERLQEALAAGPGHVLVLDGLEVLQAEGRGARARGELEDPALRRLLRALAAGLGGARALVTSRFDLVDLAPWSADRAGARTVRLQDLAPAEAVLLLERWGVTGAPAARAAAAARLGGHALSLAMAGSYAGAFLDGDPARLASVDVAAAAEDDPLARRLAGVLDHYARALAPVERDLLARIAAFPTGATPGALRAIADAGAAVAGELAGLGDADLSRALVRLERLGLVSRGHEGVLIHPFLRERFAQLLGVAPEALHAVERGRLTLTERPDGGALDAAHLDRAEALLLATLRAGLPLEAFQVYVRGLGGFAHLGLATGDLVRGARVVRAFAAGDDPAALHPRLTPELRAALAYDWGLYLGALGDLAHAERCYAAHERDALVAHGDASPERAMNLRTRAYVARLRGALPEALERIRASLHLAHGASLEGHVVRGLSLEASLLHDLGDVAGAALGFERVRALEGEPEARRALWEAEHALARGQATGAREVARRVAVACDALGWSGHVAHAHALLALAALDLREPLAAREHLAAARRWCDSSGEVEMQLRVHVVGARAALADGAHARATREAHAGLLVAAGCGFGLFEVRLRTLLAEAALARGDAEAARALAAAALDQAQAPGAGDAWGAADAAHVAGLAALRAGARPAARAILGDALARREALGHPAREETRAALGQP